jgi:flagellar hook-length control protein FliK
MPQINDKVSNPRMWNPLLHDPGLLTAQPAFGELFSAHLQQAHTAERSPGNATSDRERSPQRESAYDDENRPPAARDRADAPRNGDAASTAGTDDRHDGPESSAPPAAGDVRDDRDAQSSNAGRTDNTATQGTGEDKSSSTGPSDGKDRKDEKAKANAADTRQAEAAAQPAQTAAAAEAKNAESPTVVTDADRPAVAAARKAAKRGAAKPDGNAAGKQTTEPAADKTQKAAEQAAQDAKTAAAEEPAVEVGAAAAQSAAGAAESGVNGVQAAVAAMNPTLNGKVAAATVAGQTETPAAATDRPQRSNRREEKKEKETVAVHPAAIQPEQAEIQAAAATAAAAATVKVEAVAVAAEQMLSDAAGKTESDAATDAVQPASRNTADNQPGIAARDGTAQTPRNAAPAADQAGNQAGQVDRVRFVQRVARAFEALGESGGTVRLRLSPPELGALRLEIAVRDGAMTAHLQADNPATRNLLLDNLPALRERLAQQDIRIEQFHVDLMDQSPGGWSQQSANQAHYEQSDSGRYLPPARQRRSAETPRVAAINPAATRRPGEGNQLDVVI